MSFIRSGVALLAMLAASVVQPAFAQDSSTSSPAAGAPASVPATTPTAAAYAWLQQAWDDCFNIKSACTDLLDEGRFAPARKKWVDYHTSSLAQLVVDLKSVYEKTQLPAGVAAASDKSWADAGAAIDKMQQQVTQLQTVATNLKSPTDDKYPAAFWSPTRDILHSAADLDKSLISVLSALDNSGVAAPMTLSSAGTAGGTGRLHGRVISGDTTGSFEGVVTASQKITDTTLHMASELDRFNLSFAKAPTQPLQNEFYQGAFTKQEILSQYKYMPSFVFTTDPSVARFTYRLPPRRNMLAHYAVQIGKLLNIMDSELLSIEANFPASKKDALAAPWEAVKQKYVDARNQYQTLYNLLQKATDAQLAQNIALDQTTYGAPLIAIRNDMSQMREAINDFVSIEK